MRALGATLAFVTVEALPFVAAGLAALAAAIAGVVVFRKARRPRPSADTADERRRRAPSPASVGLDDDPIVAALRAGKGRARRREAEPASDPDDRLP
jgi:hypothetical protein